MTCETYKNRTITFLRNYLYNYKYYKYACCYPWKLISILAQRLQIWRRANKNSRRFVKPRRRRQKDGNPSRRPLRLPRKEKRSRTNFVKGCWERGDGRRREKRFFQSVFARVGVRSRDMRGRRTTVSRVSRKRGVARAREKGKDLRK